MALLCSVQNVGLDSFCSLRWFPGNSVDRCDTCHNTTVRMKHKAKVNLCLHSWKIQQEKMKQICLKSSVTLRRRSDWTNRRCGLSVRQSARSAIHKTTEMLRVLHFKMSSGNKWAASLILKHYLTTVVDPANPHTAKTTVFNLNSLQSPIISLCWDKKNGS